MKYRVNVPAPKAQRFKKSRVFLEIYGGFNECFTERLLTGLNAKFIFNPTNVVVEFEVEDEIKAYPSGWIDATEFKVCVEYSNIKGTRKEKIYLVPEKIKNDSLTRNAEAQADKPAGLPSQ